MSGTSGVALSLSTIAPNRGAASPQWSSFFRTIFPEKTAPHVATIIRTTVRAAEYVVAGRKDLSAPSLINALRSPIGAHVLDEIAGAAHWRACERRLLEIRQLEQELHDLELKRRELVQSLHR